MRAKKKNIYLLYLFKSLLSVFFITIGYFLLPISIFPFFIGIILLISILIDIKK